MVSWKSIIDNLVGYYIKLLDKFKNQKHSLDSHYDTTTV